MIARYTLTHHEGATHHLRVQVVGRLENLLRRHRTEMVRGQRRRVAIHPQREEGNIGLLEVEDDRQMVRRDVCRGDQVQAHSNVGPKLGIEPEPPGEVHVAGIVGLPIRPHEMGSQVEGPDGGIGADAAILHRGHFARRPRMHHTLRISIEERQVERLVHEDVWPVR